MKYPSGALTNAHNPTERTVTKRLEIIEIIHRFLKHFAAAQSIIIAVFAALTNSYLLCLMFIQVCDVLLTTTTINNQTSTHKFFYFFIF